MFEFIKMFGMGVLYTILFPFIVAIFLLYLVYVMLNYLTLEIFNFVGFFFGYTFTVETKLEKQMKKDKEMLLIQKEKEVIKEEVHKTEKKKGSEQE